MREKTLCVAFVLLLLIFTTIGGIGVRTASGSTLPVISMDPPINTAPSGGNFTVDINVAGITVSDSLYMWEVKINFNPSILETSRGDIDRGPFLRAAVQPQGYTTIYREEVDNDLGVVNIGEVVNPKMPPEPVYPPVGAVGNGTLATITFHVEAEGATLLHFEEGRHLLYTVKADTPVAITHEVSDGIFDNRAGPPSPPVALFYADPPIAEVNQTIHFNASASYDPDAWLVSYEWNFGDNTVKIYKDENLTDITTHAYDQGGPYTVNLTVTDYDNLTDTATADIIVGPPVANFTYSPSEPITGKAVAFNSTSSDPGGMIVSWAWDLNGDSATDATTENTTYTYTEPGIYTVNLTVTDNDGLTSSAKDDITVLAHDVAVTSVTASYITVMAGVPVTINVTVANEGNFTETFTVTVYANTTEIGTPHGVTDLAPLNEETITFTLNTTGLNLGTYTIKAVASNVTDEINVGNNMNNCTINIALFNIISHPLDVGGLTFYVVTESNSIISKISFIPADRKISFNVAGEEGASASCNVTIPKDLLDAPLDEWIVLVDGEPVTPPEPIVTPNANHTSLYFTYTLSTRKVEIIGTTAATPPVASFTTSPTPPYYVGNTLTFDASASYDPDGEIVSYEWDFGDGTSGFGNVTDHFYAAHGTYTVVLTVIDNASLRTTASFDVLVSWTKLDVDVDVGSIHFRSEIVEFYVLVSSLGKPVDASITATLYYNGTIYQSIDPTSVENVSLGLYRIPYAIPLNASPGSYALTVEASYLALSGVSLKSFLLSPTLTDWNALLISINGTVGTMKTDVGLIQVKLDDINAALFSIEGNIATIQTDIGTITADIATINAEITAINGALVTIQTDIGTIDLDISSIGATLDSVEADIVTIKTDVGIVKTDLDTIKARVTTVDGNTATIQTTLGTINGTITSIQDDIATVETDIGTIKTVLGEWTGATTSPISTPLGDFRILVLTTSTLEAPIAFSDNVVAVSLSGPSGTAGTTNMVIPKQLLVGIESSIDEVAVTIDDEQVVFTYTEQPETYVLRVTYTHSAHMVKVYLVGIPPAPFPWVVFIAALLVAVVAVAGIAVYILKIRKSRATSGSKGAATSNLQALQP